MISTTTGSRILHRVIGIELYTNGAVGPSNTNSQHRPDPSCASAYDPSRNMLSPCRPWRRQRQQRGAPVARARHLRPPARAVPCTPWRGHGPNNQTSTGQNGTGAVPDRLRISWLSLIWSTILGCTREACSLSSLATADAAASCAVLSQTSVRQIEAARILLRFCLLPGVPLPTGLVHLTKQGSTGSRARPVHLCDTMHLACQYVASPSCRSTIACV